MRNASFLLLAALAPLVAYAQDTVWRCAEADGRQQYTNIKKTTEGKSCQVVTKEVSVVHGANARPVAAPALTAAPANAQAAVMQPNFPRVDRDTQRLRDDSRRKILHDELATEEKSLVDARTKLTEQEGVRNADERNYQRVLDRLKPYQEAVERHERNVAALKQEIASLK